MKEVIKVVLLDELKLRLSAYEEPLKDLRDSLRSCGLKSWRSVWKNRDFGMIRKFPNK